ncbi:hypothetical protein [Marinicella rhabdoformis]|uniref:hypothetical protein n=1 Tax=Marinicella rhabdoformis TaxID=2580566 RepID=UPI0012AECB05|nr:hypothetical protein [Marinicella rhabdoformis]
MKFQPDEKMKQDYIQNKLSPDAKTQFEMWLFEHPSEQEELELDLILKSGVKKYYEEEAKTETHKVSWLPAFGMAAAFVLMTWGLLMPKDDMLSEGLVAPQISVFSQVRSAEQLVWNLSKESDHLIQMPVAYLSSDLYQVAINSVNEGTNEMMKISDLTPTYDMVSVLVSKGQLSEGNYQLTLTNQKSNEQQQFSFVVN